MNDAIIKTLIGGAFAISPYGVLPVFGWPILLNPVEHSIQEGAMVTNRNFHTWSAPPVLSVEDLPGPVTKQA